MARGPANRIFKNTLGEWRNTELTKHRKIPLSTSWGATADLNGASALFVGVQAGGMAYAKRKIWNEKTFDLNTRSLTQECVLNNEVNSGEARLAA
jgi:hypothetical protein